MPECSSEWRASGFFCIFDFGRVRDKAERLGMDAQSAPEQGCEGRFISPHTMCGGNARMRDHLASHVGEAFVLGAFEIQKLKSKMKLFLETKS